MAPNFHLVQAWYSDGNIYNSNVKIARSPHPSGRALLTSQEKQRPPVGLSHQAAKSRGRCGLCRASYPADCITSDWRHRGKHAGNRGERAAVHRACGLAGGEDTVDAGLLVFAGLDEWPERTGPPRRSEATAVTEGVLTSTPCASPKKAVSWHRWGRSFRTGGRASGR
jgi:hypothetical protein